MAQPSYASELDPIPRSLNALALLANGDPSYLPLIKTKLLHFYIRTPELM